MVKKSIRKPMVRKRIKKITEIVPPEATRFPLEVLKQMLTLATTSLGFVTALAWNSFIQELLTDYIKKYFPAGSGIISLFLYTVLVSILTVVVTINLSHTVERLEKLKS